MIVIGLVALAILLTALFVTWIDWVLDRRFKRDVVAHMESKRSRTWPG